MIAKVGLQHRAARRRRQSSERRAAAKNVEKRADIVALKIGEAADCLGCHDAESLVVVSGDVVARRCVITAPDWAAVHMLLTVCGRCDDMLRL